MLLSARILKDVCSVNSFEYDSQAQWTVGDSTYLYFQLIDSSLDTSLQGHSPPGRRYVPADSSSLSVVLENIDDAKKITRSAVQPYANDGSIWRLTIYSTDVLRGAPQMRLTLTEPIDQNTNKNTYGVLKSGCIRIHPATNL